MVMAIEADKKDILNILGSKRMCIVLHTFAYGPPQALKDFLKDKVEELIFIGNPFIYCKDVSSYYENYVCGRLIKKHKAYSWKFPELIQYVKDLIYTLLWMYKRNKYHIYIGASNWDVLSGLVLRGINRVDKVIYYTIDFAPYRFKYNLLNKIYIYLDRFCIRKCDLVWNLSPRMIEGREKFGLSPKYRNKQMTVQVGTERVVISINDKDINHYTIAYMGHLRKGQGVEKLIRVMPDAIKKIPLAKLKIIGIGPLEKDLKQLVKDLEIESAVEFAGYIENHDDVVRILSKCAIGVAPYEISEKSFTIYADPAKPKVYISAGLPVIITKFPQFAFDIEDKKLGIAIDDSLDGLKEAIIKLLTDDALYFLLKKNVQSFKEEIFWDKIFTKVLSNTFNKWASNE